MNIFFGDKKENLNENESNIKFLELQIIELKNQLDNAGKLVSNSQDKYSALEKAVINFCKTLMDRDYAKSQIGNKDIDVKKVDVYTLINMALNSINKQRKETNMLLLSFKNELDGSTGIVEDLKNQLSQLLVNRDLSKQEIMEIFSSAASKQQEEESHKEEPSKQEEVENVNPFTAEVVLKTTPLKSIKETPKENLSPVKVIEINDKDIDYSPNKNLKNVQNKMDNEEEKVISHVIDLNQIAKNMNDVSWKILEAIGVRGLSEKNDILNFIKHSNVLDTSDTTADNCLMELKVAGVLNRERISTGWRSFFVYEMTDTGMRLYNESGRFTEGPVMSEKRRLMKEHATARHGYGIKDVAAILNDDLNFTDISYDKNKNKIDLPNGDIYIPDVIATNPETGERCYLEYELAHHKQTDFNLKCTKLRMITNTFYFVVPTNVERSKIKRQVESWMLSKGPIPDIRAYITTTRNLKKGKWDSDDVNDDSFEEDNSKINEGEKDGNDKTGIL